MRLLYAADLHGDQTHYGALAELARDVQPAALVLGGDLFAHTHVAEEQIAFAHGPLRGFLRLASVPIYAIAGNTDWPVAVHHLEGSVCLLTLTPMSVSGGLSLIGYPFVPPTPMRRKDYHRRDLAGDAATVPDGAYVSDPDGTPHPIAADHLDRQPSIEEDLGGLTACPAPAMWVMHTPPYGTLDTVASGAHVGSRALASAIQRHQPRLLLSGHIHEAYQQEGRWAQRVGRTLVVNPGRGRRLHAVVVDLGPNGEVVSAEHSVLGPA